MKHLNKKYYIWLLIIISALAYLIIYSILAKNENPIIGFIKPISYVVMFDTLFVFAFVKWFWKWNFLYPWLVPFPNLNGTWKGDILSTWIDPITKERPDPIPSILTIKQSFISISCIMRTEEMESFSFTSDFVIDIENQVLRLIYSYDSIPKQTVRERSPQHFGTMDFKVIYDSKKELIGNYWSGRKTTGSIDMKFWKKKQLEKYPKKIGKHPVSKLRGNEK
jgi:hypothetical protein